MNELGVINSSATAQRFGGLTLDVSVCPQCGSPMYKWKNADKYGKERCGPTCINKACGYREMIVRAEKKNQQRGLDAMKKDAISRMVNNSIVTDSNVWSYSFDSYTPLDAETARAKGKCMQWSKQIANGSNMHAILTGRPGAGKTHLGMAMIDEVLKLSDFKMSCSVISYRELLEQLKFAMNDLETRKAITGSLMKDIKKSDFVVIDDLGAELGRIEEENKASNYDVDVLTSLTEARLHKATIFTTNLDSKQIKYAYGDRVFSRILNGSKGEDESNSVVFKNTADKRKNPQLLSGS